MLPLGWRPPGARGHIYLESLSNDHQFSLASPLRLFLSRGISTSIYHEMKLTISFLRSETSSSHLFMISCFSTIILFIRIGVSSLYPQGKFPFIISDKVHWVDVKACSSHAHCLFSLYLCTREVSFAFSAVILLRRRVRCLDEFSGSMYSVVFPHHDIWEFICSTSSPVEAAPSSCQRPPHITWLY